MEIRSAGTFADHWEKVRESTRRVAAVIPAEEAGVAVEDRRCSTRDTT
jgi:hypothetical protein